MVIEFQGTSKCYGKKIALQDFSATLRPGVYGLLGANGAGKTTLISLLVGLLKADSGRILADGTDIRALGRDFLSRIGYLPQYPEFYRDFAVKEFLRYMCALKGIEAREGWRQAQELLKAVNLPDIESKKIGALSGGMRQRLGIVQAVLGNPDILILDEPTAGLDPQERIRFRNLITRFSKDRTVLLATHIVSDVEFIANEVMILKEGSLIRQGTPKALEDELNGAVWNITVSNDAEQEQFTDAKISNMRRDEDGITLRLIAPYKPHPDAQLVRPSLEDVFLSFFGEAGI